MQIGLSYTSQTTVTTEQTAIAIGSGDLDVLATPALIALMENAAKTAVLEYLTDTQTTVGTAVEMKHLKAVLVGQTIKAKATLVEIDGRKLTFSIVATADNGIIGEARHERFVVDRDKFMDKLRQQD